MPLRRQVSGFAALLLLTLIVMTVSANAAAPEVRVLLWFDTEDYILPESDEALLKIADFLTRNEVPATFKMVGEKARVLESRGRNDILNLLRRHDIGYHTDFHSLPPTPASFLSPLGWFEGVKEFDRRERTGFLDVERILGKRPSCYGQPGNSWAPQAFGTLRQWGVQVYLDAGEHVSLNDAPYWYCGLLTFFRLKYTTRTELDEDADLERAKAEFRRIYQELTPAGGGIVSIYYHPCEFAHKNFWDGVNFSKGANPPREAWKIPPTKSPREMEIAHRNFESYIRFVKEFPGVRFTTASETLAVYPDRALDRGFQPEEIAEIAGHLVHNGVQPFRKGDLSLSPAEQLYLLASLASVREKGNPPEPVRLPSSSLLGPIRPVPETQPISPRPDELRKTVADVVDFLQKEGRVPDEVWFGSHAISPESFLIGLARLESGSAPATAETAPQFRAEPFPIGKHVRNDPEIWNWPVFPTGFDAPEMMELARRQAWTLKPALAAWDYER